MPGVQVRLTGSQTSLVNTNSSGQYSFTNLAAGGNYTVTPTKANYSFTPTLRTYNNLQSNITNANFTGFLNTYTISGTLRDSNNQPIPQATITLSGSQSGSVQTDGNGFYRISGLASGGNYTLTPSKLGYVFSPTSRTYNNLSGNVTGADFTGTATNYTISGYVRDEGSQPVSQVSVNLTGSQSGSTQTNSSGYYSFAGLPHGGNFILTPNKAGHYFTPLNRAYNNLNANQTGADFTASTAFSMTINYGYNSVGALSNVGTNVLGGDSTTNVINSLAFRGSGAIKSLNYGNGRRLQMGYSPQRQQPTAMTVDRADGSDKIIDSVYDYYDGSGHNNGRIRKITDLVDGAYSMEYAYDDYNRLTNATAGPVGSATYTRSYQYDAWGNTRNFNGLTFNYQTNPSGAPSTNRITSDSAGATFGYDNAGNMTSSPGWTFAFDGASRLKQATGGSTSTYGYDGDGMRVRQTAGGNPLYYVRSSVLGQVVMEVNSSQGVYRAYVYSGSKLLGQRSHDGNFYWVHTNHLNSARWLMDAGGFAIYRGEFDPYGQAVFEYVATSSLNSHKFTGYERDAATGLDYANARMYNSGRGRFMQPDMMGLGSAELNRPQSLNRYAYVGNDPVNFVDPSGLDEEEFTIYVGKTWAPYPSWNDLPHGSRSLFDTTPLTLPVFQNLKKRRKDA